MCQPVNRIPTLTKIRRDLPGALTCTLKKALIDFIGQLRDEPQAGIDRAPRAILCSRDFEYIPDGTVKFFFKDLFWEIVCPALEGPDPFTPEPHALDIADPAWLDMVCQEFIENPELGGLLKGDVETVRLVAFVEPVQNAVVCRVHGGWGKNVCRTHGSA